LLSRSKRPVLIPIMRYATIDEPELQGCTDFPMRVSHA
jgi:hypothetical protein